MTFVLHARRQSAVTVIELLVPNAMTFTMEENVLVQMTRSSKGIMKPPEVPDMLLSKAKG